MPNPLGRWQTSTNTQSGCSAHHPVLTGDGRLLEIRRHVLCTCRQAHDVIMIVFCQPNRLPYSSSSICSPVPRHPPNPSPCCRACLGVGRVRQPRPPTGCGEFAGWRPRPDYVLHPGTPPVLLTLLMLLPPMLGVGGDGGGGDSGGLVDRHRRCGWSC